jgi:hypothetical protein
VQIGNAPLAGIQTVNLNQTALGTVQFFDVPVPDPLHLEHRLLTLNPGTRTVQYVGIRLWPTPAGVYTYHIDGDLSIVDLSVVGLPILPEDFQFILADYARMREYEYRDDSRFPMAQMRYEQKLKQMRNRIIDPPDFRPRCGSIPDRSSNLSGDFPPGRW